MQFKQLHVGVLAPSCQLQCTLALHLQPLSLQTILHNFCLLVVKQFSTATQLYLSLNTHTELRMYAEYKIIIIEDT